MQVIETNQLHCLLINARSLNNKTTELHQLLYNTNTDCLFVTETWLYDGISNGLLDPYNKFTIFRQDRLTATVGGGVCVFINKKNDAHKVDIASVSSLGL